MATLTDDYVIEFDGNADPFSDSDWTDVKNDFNKVSGELKPGITPSGCKVMATGLTVDYSAAVLSVKMVLTSGVSDSNDIGGPAWYSGTASPNYYGGGFCLVQIGNNIYLYIQGSAASWPGATMAHSFGSESWVSTDIIELEITGHTSSPLDIEIACKRNGSQVGTVYSVPSEYHHYVFDGMPGAGAANGSGSNNRGWSELGFTGTTSGGWSVSTINGGTGIIKHGEAWTIEGDFVDVTIATIELVENFGSPAVRSYTVTGWSYDSPRDSITCPVFDIFATPRIMTGTALLVITPSGSPNTPKYLGATIAVDSAVEPYLLCWFSDVGQAGWFKDVPGLAAGDFAAVPDLGSSSPQEDITVDAATGLAVFTPAVPHGTALTGYWYNLSGSPIGWEDVVATIYQYDPAGPAWAALPTWPVTANNTDTYDLTQHVTGSTSPENVTGYDLLASPNPPGFTMSGSPEGEITFDGTLDPGVYWIQATATDAGGTTTSPVIRIDVITDEMTISNDRATGIGQFTATLGIDCNSLDGDVYCVVDIYAPPSPNTLAYIQGGGSPVPFYSSSGTAENSVSFYLEGMTVSTTYFYSFIQEDAGRVSNIVEGSFTTKAIPAFSADGRYPVRRP